ncbi:SCO3242 family prenyltransferase [Saccharopolyspora sp. NPDC000359]|uniref:SCO3242 family prenyltransferase n=1 Tax=Saccharopolyspora sp. NPDC000359 TaxID=3154251 RepID=UPI003317D3A7
MRAPAVLTVLGDTVAGAAAAGAPLRGRRWALTASSAALYWAGMAINDWADREVDASERPERPIPSGQVGAGAALATGAALCAAGLGLAWLGGGRRAAGVAALLVGSIWGYDTVLKATPAGPLGMAACRVLDVLLGAGSGWRAAVPTAAALGAHTLGVTALSSGEVHGGSPATARAALVGTAVSAGLVAGGRRLPLSRGLVALGFGAAYGVTVGRAQHAAVHRPSAAQVRAATVAGIHGMIPLQAGLAARHGAVRAAAVLALALPLARKLGRKVSPT